MLAEPYPSFTAEELEYAKKIRATYSDDTLESDLCVSGCPESDKRNYLQQMKQAALMDTVKEYRHQGITVLGSSDVGDCSQVVPTAQFTGACFTPGTPGHSWQMVTQGKSSYAIKVMLWGARVLARAALQAVFHPEIVESAKQAFTETTGGRKYVCPIPAEIKPKSHSKILVSVQNSREMINTAMGDF